MKEEKTDTLPEQKKLLLLTDSGTDVPQSFVDAYGIQVLPLEIIFSDQEHLRSGIDISPQELVERIDEMPSTSLPSLTSILEALRAAQAEGFAGAVFAGIASGLSGTCNAVRTMADQLPDFDVLVADSKSIGVAAGMVVMEAARKIREGVSLSALDGLLQQVADNTRVFFSVPELGYLRRGGRISEATYRLGSLLSICPVITCDVKTDGHYEPIKKVRGFERALNSMVDLAVKQAQHYKEIRLAICCSVREQMRFDELEAKLRTRIADNVTIVEVIRSAVSADLLVHTGPSLVGIGVQGIH